MVNLSQEDLVAYHGSLEERADELEGDELEGDELEEDVLEGDVLERDQLEGDVLERDQLERDVLEGAPTRLMNFNDDSFVSSCTEEHSDDDDDSGSDIVRDLLDGLSTFELSDLCNLGENAKYFINTLLQSLDSSDLDESLVTEAQLSGHLNNENQKLIEKRELLAQKLARISHLFEINFSSTSGGAEVGGGARARAKISRLEHLKNEIETIENRLAQIVHGKKPTFALPFAKAKKKTGVLEKYPIEYNQARDKVLERIVDDDTRNK
ncbi:KXD1 [Candida oxycetoniae]|uniref:Biogenesis of lysosome-related organelles complex 1 subunit KXD1 n=1 Tax=Candida oxycetoniae TaxID=497107 RepID=A0AAI9SZL9_9ASCO|nr:KXD1 [Candida oxycetoniae]KAI3405624.2 KXD1 [Candida oxycetoniae]